MQTEIEIPVAELRAVLPGLAKIVGRSSTLPVLNCIKVALDKEEQFVSLQARAQGSDGMFQRRLQPVCAQRCLPGRQRQSGSLPGRHGWSAPVFGQFIRVWHPRTTHCAHPEIRHLAGVCKRWPVETENAAG